MNSKLFLLLSVIYFSTSTMETQTQNNHPSGMFVDAFLLSPPSSSSSSSSSSPPQSYRCETIWRQHKHQNQNQNENKLLTSILSTHYDPYHHHHHHHHQDTSLRRTRLNLKSQQEQVDEVDKGFNLLGLASQFIPQGKIVSTAKESWKFLWQRFMVELAPQDKSGSYQRPQYTFDGTLGSIQHPTTMTTTTTTTTEEDHLLDPRYHVYVGNPCPWCHRVRLVVNILDLQKNRRIGMTQLVDDPIKASRGGWVFDEPLFLQANGGNDGDNKGASTIQDLRQLYEFLSPGYQGRCTAPLLVDWKTQTIISNESKDIVRMLPLLQETSPSSSSSFPTPLVPAELQKKIDDTNQWVYEWINNGCYQCGFATTQAAYDRASRLVRQGLDRCEDLLEKQPYICGTVFTESDILLLPTMLRFDAVYAPLFGAGGSRHWKLQSDYPHIHQWLRRCWQDVPGVSTSIDLDDATKSYYRQLFPLNPGGIVPSVTMTPQRLGLEKEENKE